MRWCLLFVSLALAACNTPTPRFYGVPPIEVAVDGNTYRVFRVEDRAQAIRVNSTMRPNLAAELTIIGAIEGATGCQVKGDLKGDVVLANARIDCGAGARPWPPEPIRIRLQCDQSAVVAERVECFTY